MITSFSLRAFAAAAFVVGISAGCGSKDEGGGDSAPAPETDKKTEANQPPGPTTPTPRAPESTQSSSRISDGKYYLTAGTVEAFDTAGNKLDPQPLQITGDYVWIVKFLEDSKYEITTTGSAKINNSNQVLVEVNCRGAQDVFVLDVTSSGAIRNLKQTETGCPQGLQPVSAQQMSIERIDTNSFAYTVVNQNQGARVIETYTFKK